MKKLLFIGMLLIGSYLLTSCEKEEICWDCTVAKSRTEYIREYYDSYCNQTEAQMRHRINEFDKTHISKISGESLRMKCKIQ